MTALKSFAFLFTSSSRCCHSLSTHARVPALLTAAGSLSSHARLIYPRRPNVIQIDSLHFHKKKEKRKKDGEPGDFWGTFHYFSTLIRNERIRFSKGGRRAGVASAFTACQIGRFAKRSCAPHQAYKLSKDNTHPSCTKLSNRIAAARAEKKKIAIKLVLMRCLYLRPGCLHF